MLDDFTRVLRFKPHLLVLDAGPDALFVVDEFRRSVLSGAEFVSLAACLHKRMSIADIFAALSGRFSEWQLLAALDHLVQKAYVRADPPDSRDRARGFFERTGLDGDEACERAARLRVGVEAFGVDTDAQVHAFLAGGIEVEPGAPLTIALTDSHAHPELADAAARAQARGGALLIVVTGGVQSFIGPLLTRDQDDAPCIECVRHWTGINRPVQTLLARYHGAAASHLPHAHTRASSAAVAAMVVAFVEQLGVSGERLSHARSHIASLRADTLATAAHRVVRRPQCPRCGNPGWMREQAAHAPRLSASNGLARRDGGYRSVDPQQTFQRYQHLISPVSGAVAYLHPMPGRHGGLRRVYVAGYLACPDGVPRENRFDRVSSGKGRSDEQARVSALCETLERFSAVYQGDEAVVRGSMAGLAKVPEWAGAPIHVNALQQISELQFQSRDVINESTGDARKQVPPRFNADDEIDWTPAWSLITARRRLVPLNYCYADAPRASGAFCVHNPNGSAGGSCIEEAILQGTLELIERDAVAIWWYNQIPRPGIDVASFKDEYFDALMVEYEALGWRLWALDITHDLQIPVVVALAENPATGRFSIGFGCHLDSRIALQRALTEVNQLLDLTANAPPPWDHAKLSCTRFLYPGVGLPLTDASTWSHGADLDMNDAIAHCIGRVSAAGFDMLVVDKTRPDICLAVVQVIVPGLCHFWPRFGAERLYTVPVRQGWLEYARNERELNPALLFL